MNKVKQELVELEQRFDIGDIEIVDLQRLFSKVLMSSEADSMEKVAKKFDNDLELAIHTLSDSKQRDAVAKIISEAMIFLDENIAD